MVRAIVESEGDEIAAIRRIAHRAGEPGVAHDWPFVAAEQIDPGEAHLTSGAAEARERDRRVRPSTGGLLEASAPRERRRAAREKGNRGCGAEHLHERTTVHCSLPDRGVASIRRQRVGVKEGAAVWTM